MKSSKTLRDFFLPSLYFKTKNLSAFYQKAINIQLQWEKDFDIFY